MDDLTPLSTNTVLVAYVARREAVEIHIAALPEPVQKLVQTWRKAIQQYGRCSTCTFGDLAAIERFVADVEIAYTREKAAGYVAEAWRTGI